MSSPPIASTSRPTDSRCDRLRSTNDRHAGCRSLTDAEARVAALVVEGLTNVEIARRLLVSRRTIDTHVLVAYRKLEVRSRVQLMRAILGASAEL